MNKELKFKLGQTVYVISTEWYSTNIRKYKVTSISLDNDIIYYTISDNGSTIAYESNMFSTFNEANEFIIKRLKNKIKQLELEKRIEE